MAEPVAHPASASGCACARPAWARPACWALFLLLVLAEGAARVWGPAPPSCATSRRNPYRFRGWPEYVEGAAETSAGRRTVVILTNCQGYGAEVPGWAGYPAALEGELAVRGVLGDADWRVVNWALDGATSIEYVVLAAYLRDLKPAAVVASLAFADFRAEHFAESWRYARSDVPRLATRPAVFRNLPRSFWQRHARAEETLEAWATDHCALLRAKEYAWSWLEEHLPGSHFALYAPAINYHPWRISGQRAWRPPIRPVGVARIQDLDLLYDERSTAMLDELAAVLAAGPAPVALVAQPFRDGHVHAATFARDLEAAAARHGLPFWNLQQAIPREEFMSSNHLNHRGHRRLARELAARLDAWLAAGTGDNP